MVIPTTPVTQPTNNESIAMIVSSSIRCAWVSRFWDAGGGLGSGPRSCTNSAMAIVGSVMSSRPMSGGSVDVAPWCAT